MKNKQIIGMIVAGIMLVFIAATGVLMNQVSNKLTTESTSMLELLNQENYGFDLPSGNFVGIVDVQGTIMETTGVDSIFNQGTEYDHTYTLKYIDALMDSSNNQGILLYVNTPGGSVTASDELYLKLEEYKKQTNRPIYAYMASQACSGGYYISMAAEHIMANRNCWTGSIGVIVNLINYEELYDKLGIKEINITSGVNKAMGAGGSELTQEQRDIMQSLVDEAYDQFVSIVATGRGLEETKVRTLADGRIYSALQAKENALIDEVVLSYDEAQTYVSQTIEKPVSFYRPERETSVLNQLFGKLSQLGQSRSEIEIISELMEKQGNGVPMYYAKP